MRKTLQSAFPKPPINGTSPFMSKVSREEERKRFYVKSKYMDVSLLETTNTLGKYNPNYKTVYKSIAAHRFSEVRPRDKSLSPASSS